ncbi:HAD-IB family phosphatase [Candidatus Bathyarchaeota archaeon]|nr:HAD-IB family phosphatase [Candidatus Bathyarchaeota archaeon]
MKIKLVIFDVEGVLLRGGYLLFEAAKKLSYFKFSQILGLGLLYQGRILSPVKTVKLVFRLLRGFPMEELMDIYRRTPLSPGAKEAIQSIKAAGLKAALVSSGLPESVVNDLKERLGADYGYGVVSEVRNGRITGNVGGLVMEKDGKKAALREICELEKITPLECAAVGDDHSNLPLFTTCGLRIAYNADPDIKARADLSISGDLAQIVPLILNKIHARSQPQMRQREFARYLIHCLGFTVPFISILVGNALVALLILVSSVMYFFSENLRLKGAKFPILTDLTLYTAREGESYRLVVAPLYFAAGIFLTLILFSAPISYVAITILTLGDSTADLFGKLFGRTPYPFNKAKTIEGSLCGLAASFGGALLFTTPVTAIVGALVGMMIEALPLPIDDNLSVPLAVAIALLIVDQVL